MTKFFPIRTSLLLFFLPFIAQADEKKWGPFVSTDLLFWDATQGGIEYAITSHSSTTTSLDGKVKEIDFDWGPGYRVGFGYQFNRWDFFINWTRFHNHCSSSARPPQEGSLFALWVPANLENATSELAHARWHLLYDTVDLELGYVFQLTKSFSMRPFVGARWALIDQHGRYHYEEVDSSQVGTLFDAIARTKNGYDAGGARTGAQLHFIVNHHWSFYGALAGSLLYGRFDLKVNFRTTPQVESDETLGYRSHFNEVQGNLEGALGLQWETSYTNGRYHLSILACYEWNQWFNFNKLHKNVAAGVTNPNFFSNDTDLGLQGATLSTRFAF
jgi:hypothetical protein